MQVKTSKCDKIFEEIIFMVAFAVFSIIGFKGLKAIYLHYLRRKRGQFSSRKTTAKSLTRGRVSPIKTKDEAQW